LSLQTVPVRDTDQINRKLSVSTRHITPDLLFITFDIVPLYPQIPHFLCVSLQVFDVEDWQRHTVFRGFAEGAPQPGWLCQVRVPEATRAAMPHTPDILTTPALRHTRLVLPGVKC
jgi:hypothetical protein